MRLNGSAALVLVALLGVSTGSEAQIRASERATVSQTVDGTTITVDYARPRIRGRSQVFGDEVKWEEIWTPGANMATTLEVSKDVQINGHPVPKGKYSVWMQVNRGDWIFMLDTTVERFHTVRPNKDSVMLRFNIRPDQKPRMEVLTWWFPDVRADRAVLAMQWDKYYVPVTITVPSSFSMAVASDVARPIVGTYEMRWTPPPPDTSAAKDSTHAEESGHEEGGEGPPDAPMNLDVTYNRGSLWVHLTPAPFPGYDTMVLLQMKGDWFVAGWWKNGELYDVSDDMIMEFKIENGQASGFEMRMKNDELIATATRTR